jgi:RNA polymerase sigma-70 factor (ECF subfamily)
VHEVFLIAHRKLPTFEGRSALRTWLFAITHRVVQHFRRTRDREARRSAPYTEEAAGSVDPHRRTDAQRTLLTLLARLDEAQRLVFILTELEGMTSAEVAAALALPPGTVDTRRRLARVRLTNMIEQERAREGSLER